MTVESPPAVLVLGAGSIGARHARNLLAAGARVAVMDPDGARAKAIEGAVAVPFDLARVAEHEAVVIASPTRFHAEHARAALDGGCMVLLEKPVAVTASEVPFLREHATRVMVGYNLRFHRPVRLLRAMTDDGVAGPVRSARFWFGSHLPDWRPDVDYRTTYSAQRSLGGGVLLDAIHELDLAVWWFGPKLSVVGAVVSRLGALAIDVDDTVRALLRSDEQVPIEISLDYLSRRYRRGIELIGDDATIRFDWTRGRIEVERPSGVEELPDDVPVARSYELQAEHFLAWVRGEAQVEADGSTGLASLELADAIRTAAASTT